MKQDQFKNRYIIKLSSSIVIMILNAIIQLLIPRVLSVKEFGYYSYNLNVFTAVVGITNLQTSNALIAKFSKRNEEIGLLRFYFKFCLVAAIATNILVMALYPVPFVRESFAGQTLLIVLLGLETAFATRFLSDDIAVYDAMAISRFPAKVQVMLKVLISLIVIIGFILGKLTLIFFYISQLLITVCAALYLLFAAIKEQKTMYPNQADFGTKAYLKEYFVFCRPLVISNLVSQGGIIFMNWALMRWSGAAGQAMFGAAWQLNSMVACVFSPYAELTKREFSIAIHDSGELKRQYVQALKIMIWMTCYFALFIGFFADWILPVVYGDKYREASMVTLLIMVYTVYQAWGQISGSLQLALEKTRIIAVYGVIGQIITLLFSFLFQIPNSIWPQGLGAMGIALTYICTNVVSVNIAIVINSRLVETYWLDDLSIQVIPVIFCSGLAAGLHVWMNTLIPVGGTLSGITKVILAGSVYTIIIAGIIWCFPQLLGVTRESLGFLLRKRGTGRRK